MQHRDSAQHKAHTVGQEPPFSASRRLAFVRARIGLPGGTSDIGRFLVVYAVLYYAAIVIMRWPSPVWDDMLEAWAWGSQLQLGYYKHPPFYSWVAFAWFQLFPRADWAFYLLSMASVCVGLAGVWRLSDLFAMSPQARTLSVGLLTLMPPYNLMASNFNADTVLLAVWPWTAYAFIRALIERSEMHAVLFGALSAVALLCKYYSIVFLMSCFVAALLHPTRSQTFTWFGPYVSVAVCVLLCLPHVMWAISESGPTVAYAVDRMRSRYSWPLSAAAGLAIGGASVALMLVAAVSLAAAIGRRRLRKVGRAPQQFLRRVPVWLAALAIGPGVLTVLVSILGVSSIILNFFIPNYFLIPVVAMLALGSWVDRRCAEIAMMPALMFPVLAIVFAPVVARSTVALGIKETGDVSIEIVRGAGDHWLREVGTPVAIIGGTKKYALAGSFYLPEAPKYFSNFSFKESPWVSPADIHRHGILILCEAEDLDCLQNVKNSFGTRPVKTFQVAAQREFLGARGKVQHVEGYVFPPRE